MKAENLTLAARATQTDEGTLCLALRTLLPVLRRLRDDTSGWMFWLRLGLGAVIDLLSDYADDVCGDRA